MSQCPLCPFEDDDSYALMLHVEFVHFGQDSPFVVLKAPAGEESSDTTQNNSKDSDVKAREEEEDNADAAEEGLKGDGVDDGDEYLLCPEDDCGEQVLWRDMQEHLDYHIAERLGEIDQSEESPSPSSAALAAASTPDMYGLFHYPYHSSCVDQMPQSSMPFTDVSQTCPAAESSRPAAFTIVPQQIHPSQLSLPSTTHTPLSPSLPSLSPSTPRSPDYTELWCRTQHLIASSLGYSSAAPPVVVATKNLKRRHASTSSSSGRSRLSRRSTTAALTQQNCVRGRRMGQAELGPYAFEDQMPNWLRKLLLNGAKCTTTQRLTSTGQLYKTTQVENEVSGLVPVIAGLLEDDTNISEAWVCHPSVQHVFKLPNEGGFCGYRNMQMLLSFIVGTQWTGWETIASCIAEKSKSDKHHKDKIPNILQLQDMIESGWDMGFNSHSRMETGGIRGTRKYIGTPETHSLLAFLNIPHGTFSCTDKIFPGELPRVRRAHDQLLDHVQRYFSSGDPEPQAADSSSSNLPSGSSTHIHRTQLPPLFLQQPGHSLTIIGIEVAADGQQKLLVFDPAFKPSAGITKLLNRQNQASLAQLNVPINSRSIKSNGPARAHENKAPASSSSNPPKGSVPTATSKRDNAVVSSKPNKKQIEKKRQDAMLLLEAYRRGKGRLGRHQEFEMVRLVAVNKDSG